MVSSVVCCWPPEKYIKILLRKCSSVPTYPARIKFKLSSLDPTTLLPKIDLLSRKWYQQTQRNTSDPFWLSVVAIWIP